MLDELYDTNELQPEFVEETEKPYDKYLKLHNYDPKTNTIEIDGKRVNAGARGSNKERNRMNKILRENDYDPKTGTYKSDIKVKNPETGNMENKRIKMNFDTRKSTAATTTRTADGIKWDKSHINIEPKNLKKKPAEAGSTLKHEEGHIHDYSDQPYALGGRNRSKEIRDLKDEIKEVNEKDFKDLRYSAQNEQMKHAKDPDEKYADLYGALHNKHGFSGTKQNLSRYKNEYKDDPEETKKKYTKELNKIDEKLAKGVDKDKIIENEMSYDGNYDWLIGKKNDSEATVSRFEKKLEMSPEDRLENILGYSPKEIEELKKSGKFEDTLKAERMDDEFLKSRMKKYSDEASDYDEKLKEYSKELLNDEDFQKKTKERIAKAEHNLGTMYDYQKRMVYDNLDAKKNFDAEMDSRSNYVERKIRELAEKDPEVKRKLAQYDEAIARRKQKLEKRKANKAEAREKEARRAQVQTEYYLDDIEITW